RIGTFTTRCPSSQQATARARWRRRPTRGRRTRRRSSRPHGGRGPRTGAVSPGRSVRRTRVAKSTQLPLDTIPCRTPVRGVRKELFMRTVFAGGRVFDGTGAPIAEADVAISDGVIAEVGVGLDGDDLVDVSGLTILPGLFDCHVHVLLGHVDIFRLLQTPFSYRFYDAIRNLDATLRIGITTVRDAGGADLGVKQALEEGILRGPRMQISITMLSQTGGHGDGWLPSGSRIDLFPPHPGAPAGIVDGPEEVRRKVRELVRAGADVIKIATS